MAAAAAAVLCGVTPAVAAQPSPHVVADPPPTAANPSVSGPVTGGHGIVQLQGTSFQPSDVGYTQSEYFLSGTAKSYRPAKPLSSNGEWQVKTASTARYTTRIVVDRPTNPAKFNGTVIVEWLNVTAGFDTAADWTYGHDELVRDGFAWVGVSAQAAGVTALKGDDPVRYAALSHPGDSYSYDIFSQAGQAIRDESGKILGGLKPRAVLADGESQSAFRLTTYIDAVQPLVHEYNGFLVHSRAGSGAPLSQSPQATVLDPKVVHFRSDLGVPVLDVEAETDLFFPVATPAIGGGPYLAAQQPDSSGFRLWEIAGTAHADAYDTGFGAGDTGNGVADGQQFNALQKPPTGIPPGLNFITCNKPINAGDEHYVIDAAEYALNRWVRTGTPPAHAARLKVNATGTGYVRDGNGNVEGGIRTPAVQVPIAALSGLGNGAPGTGLASLACVLAGTTAPFSAAKLARLYPTHAKFVANWAMATVTDEFAGFIRPADARNLIEAAVNSTIGG
jgi:hypothetical protein